MNDQLTSNPWLSMWVRPRRTIREIVTYNPRYRFAVLSGLYGFPMLIQIAEGHALGNYFSFWALVIASIVLSVFVGMALISISAALVYWTGKWIGGQGSFIQIRAAAAWSNVTQVPNILLWIVLLATFQETIFCDSFGQPPFQGRELHLLAGVFLLQMVISVWSLVIWLKSLGEVQGFSAWKALLNVLIPAVLVGVAIWLGWWVFSLMTQTYS